MLSDITLALAELSQHQKRIGKEPADRRLRVCVRRYGWREKPVKQSSDSRALSNEPYTKRAPCERPRRNVRSHAAEDQSSHRADAIGSMYLALQALRRTYGYNLVNRVYLPDVGVGEMWRAISRSSKRHRNHPDRAECQDQGLPLHT